MTDCETKHITLTLWELPPSANHMRRQFIRDGKVASVKSDAYAKWKKAAAWEICSKTRNAKIAGPYHLSIAVERKARRDLDNFIKPISDALVAANLVEDDSLAESIHIEWRDDVEASNPVWINVVAA